MKTTFRVWFTFAVAFATGAFAQSFPSKPVRLIVPFPAGGGSDVIGRILAQKFTERFGQNVVVDNRAGAGGSIGTEAAVRSALRLGATWIRPTVPVLRMGWSLRRTTRA